ncbi:MAG: nucleotidyltransferase domain-containing protein [Candidatus Omnitrophota bacterium]
MKNIICGLGKDVIDQIIQTILDRKEVEKIVIFGSRANENYGDVSDIDIAVFGKKWTSTDINIVKFQLDEYVKTPLKFDIINFHGISKPKLKEDIVKYGRIIYES